MQVQQIGGMRANLARLREPLDSTAARGVESSGGLPIGSVKRSISAMAAGGRSARVAASWPSWKQRAKLRSTAAAPWRGAANRRCCTQPVAWRARCRPRWAGSGTCSWCFSRRAALDRNTLGTEHPLARVRGSAHQLRVSVGRARLAGWRRFAASARRLRRAMPGLAATRGAARVVGLCRDPPRGGLPQLGFARPGSGRAGSGHGPNAVTVYRWLLETFVDEREPPGRVGGRRTGCEGPRGSSGPHPCDGRDAQGSVYV